MQAGPSAVAPAPAPEFGAFAFAVVILENFLDGVKRMRDKGRNADVPVKGDFDFILYPLSFILIHSKEVRVCEVTH
jgi:hypothetical protein